MKKHKKDYTFENMGGHSFGGECPRPDVNYWRRSDGQWFKSLGGQDLDKIPIAPHEALMDVIGVHFGAYSNEALDATVEYRNTLTFLPFELSEKQMQGVHEICIEQGIGFEEFCHRVIDSKIASERSKLAVVTKAA